MNPGARNDWLGVLERHRQRRAEGIPTVTVIAGDGHVATWLWRSTPTIGARACVVTRGVEEEDVIEQWLGGAEVTSALRAAILGLMARDAGTTTAELACRLAGRSAWQLDELAERTSGLHGLALSTVRDAMGLPLGRRESRGDAALREAERLLGLLPPLLVDPDPVSPDSLCRAAMTVVAFAEALAAADVGLLIGNVSLDALRCRVPDRVITTLKEGLLRLRTPDAPNDGAAEPGAILEYDREAFARSRVELKLFETLNGRAQTNGLFKLNQSIEPSGGGVPLEIDLLCRGLRLAVEVDGYHHFRDALAYRRDRRKDVLLQHLGYVVVRVLASDVDSELQHVLEIIDGAVERLRRRTP